MCAFEIDLIAFVYYVKKKEEKKSYIIFLSNLSYTVNLHTVITRIFEHLRHENDAKFVKEKKELYHFLVEFMQCSKYTYDDHTNFLIFMT